LVLAKTDGVVFIPAALAEDAISHAEFTSLEDDYNFELNKEGKNGGQFEGGWTPAKYQGLAQWIDAHPEKLKMPRSEFDALLAERSKPRQAH
jgi:4-hydroxy-4-methyl-2-oxoglutarate aldolase